MDDISIAVLIIFLIAAFLIWHILRTWFRR